MQVDRDRDMAKTDKNTRKAKNDGAEASVAAVKHSATVVTMPQSGRRAANGGATDMPAASERRAQGKALRDAVPRTLHAGWKAPTDRRDPIDLLIESNEGRIPDLIPIRFGRMMQSPFTFYRGSAASRSGDHRPIGVDRASLR
jgi:hypothetical protein